MDLFNNEVIVEGNCQVICLHFRLILWVCVTLCAGSVLALKQREECGRERKETHTHTHSHNTLFLSLLSWVEYYASFGPFLLDTHKQTNTHFISPHLFLAIDLHSSAASLPAAATNKYKATWTVCCCLSVCVRGGCLNAGHLVFAMKLLTAALNWW